MLTDDIPFPPLHFSFPGMLSCQQEQNVIDGKKRIVLNPSEAQKREFETVTFAEGEVWGVDILVSSGEDGKVREASGVPTHPQYFSSPQCSEGSVGRIPDNDLPERFHSHVSTQNEDVPCGLLRGAEKSRRFPIQYPGPGGGKES